MSPEEAKQNLKGNSKDSIVGNSASHVQQDNGGPPENTLRAGEKSSDILTFPEQERLSLTPETPESYQEKNKEKVVPSLLKVHGYLEVLDVVTPGGLREELDLNDWNPKDSVEERLSNDTREPSYLKDDEQNAKKSNFILKQVSGELQLDPETYTDALKEVITQIHPLSEVSREDSLKGQKKTVSSDIKSAATKNIAPLMSQGGIKKVSSKPPQPQANGLKKGSYTAKQQVVNPILKSKDTVSPTKKVTQAASTVKNSGQPVSKHSLTKSVRAPPTLTETQSKSNAQTVIPKKTETLVYSTTKKGMILNSKGASGKENNLKKQLKKESTPGQQVFQSDPLDVAQSMMSMSLEKLPGKKLDGYQNETGLNQQTHHNVDDDDQLVKHSTLNFPSESYTQNVAVKTVSDELDQKNSLCNVRTENNPRSALKEELNIEKDQDASNKDSFVERNAADLDDGPMQTDGKGKTVPQTIQESNSNIIKFPEESPQFILDTETRNLETTTKQEDYNIKSKSDEFKVEGDNEKKLSKKADALPYEAKVSSQNVSNESKRSDSSLVTKSEQLPRNAKAKSALSLQKSSMLSSNVLHDRKTSSVREGQRFSNRSKADPISSKVKDGVEISDTARDVSNKIGKVLNVSKSAKASSNITAKETLAKTKISTPLRVKETEAASGAVKAHPNVARARNTVNIAKPRGPPPLASPRGVKNKPETTKHSSQLKQIENPNVSTNDVSEPGARQNETAEDGELENMNVSNKSGGSSEVSASTKGLDDNDTISQTPHLNKIFQTEQMNSNNNQNSARESLSDKSISKSGSINREEPVAIKNIDNQNGETTKREEKIYSTNNGESSPTIPNAQGESPEVLETVELQDAANETESVTAFPSHFSKAEAVEQVSLETSNHEKLEKEKNNELGFQQVQNEPSAILASLQEKSNRKPSVKHSNPVSKSILSETSLTDSALKYESRLSSLKNNIPTKGLGKMVFSGYRLPKASNSKHGKPVLLSKNKEAHADSIKQDLLQHLKSNAVKIKVNPGVKWSSSSNTIAKKKENVKLKIPSQPHSDSRQRQLKKTPQKKNGIHSVSSLSQSPVSRSMSGSLETEQVPNVDSSLITHKMKDNLPAKESLILRKALSLLDFPTASISSGNSQIVGKHLDESPQKNNVISKSRSDSEITFNFHSSITHSSYILNDMYVTKEINTKDPEASKPLVEESNEPKNNNVLVAKTQENRSMSRELARAANKVTKNPYAIPKKAKHNEIILKKLSLNISKPDSSRVIKVNSDRHSVSPENGMKPTEANKLRKEPNLKKLQFEDVVWNQNKTFVAPSPPEFSKISQSKKNGTSRSFTIKSSDALEKLVDRENSKLLSPLLSSEKSGSRSSFEVVNKPHTLSQQEIASQNKEKEKKQKKTSSRDRGTLLKKDKPTSDHGTPEDTQDGNVVPENNATSAEMGNKDKIKKESKKKKKSETSSNELEATDPPSKTKKKKKSKKEETLEKDTEIKQSKKKLIELNVEDPKKAILEAKQVQLKDKNPVSKKPLSKEGKNTSELKTEIVQKKQAIQGAVQKKETREKLKAQPTEGKATGTEQHVVPKASMPPQITRPPPRQPLENKTKIDRVLEPITSGLKQKTDVSTKKIQQLKPKAMSFTAHLLPKNDLYKRSASILKKEDYEKGKDPSSHMGNMEEKKAILEGNKPDSATHPDVNATGKKGEGSVSFEDKRKYPLLNASQSEPRRPIEHKESLVDTAPIKARRDILNSLMSHPSKPKRLSSLHTDITRQKLESRPSSLNNSLPTLNKSAVLDGKLSRTSLGNENAILNNKNNPHNSSERQQEETSKSDQNSGKGFIRKDTSRREPHKTEKPSESKDTTSEPLASEALKGIEKELKTVQKGVTLNRSQTCTINKYPKSTSGKKRDDASHSYYKIVSDSLDENVDVREVLHTGDFNTFLNNHLVIAPYEQNKIHKGAFPLIDHRNSTYPTTLFGEADRNGELEYNLSACRASSVGFVKEKKLIDEALRHYTSVDAYGTSCPVVNVEGCVCIPKWLNLCNFNPSIDSRLIPNICYSPNEVITKHFKSVLGCSTSLPATGSPNSQKVQKGSKEYLPPYIAYVANQPLVINAHYTHKSNK